jgi:hypothetical protein
MDPTMPAALTQALSAKAVTDLLEAKCEQLTGINGTSRSAWRILDKDLKPEELTLLPAPLATLYAKAQKDCGGKVPWVASESPKGVTSRAYPTTVNDAVAYFQSL